MYRKQWKPILKSQGEKHVEHRTVRKRWMCIVKEIMDLHYM